MADELQLQTGPYRTTFTGLEIERASTLDEWRSFGKILHHVDEAKQWAIGDWLADGKTHYNDGVYKEAAIVLGEEYSYNSLARLKRVGELFEISLRRLNLTWSHHNEVASVMQLEEVNGKLQKSKKPDIDKIQDLLVKAEKGEDNKRWPVSRLKQEVAAYKRRQDEEIRLYNEPEKYNVILVDPAWQYDFSRSDSRKIDNQYTPSSMEEMIRLQAPAAEDCVMFMWATSPKLREALELIDKWGFEYKTCMIWVKDKIGMGYYARQKHELLLIATKGNLQLPDESIRPDSVFYANRTGHSEKPELGYEMIEAMYPEYKKIELFARQKREGWEVWGDESR